MLTFDIGFELSAFHWALVIISAIMMGASKAGLYGVSTLTVPIMAMVFGGKPSAGLVLPLLSFADTFAVIQYRRSAEWHHIIKLAPWVIAGVLLGVFIGELISDKIFKEMMAFLILGSMAILIWRESRKKELAIPSKWWFSATLGIAGGFATMIGNAAGPIMALYFMAMNLPKVSYIGTAAWFFFLVNVFKLPFHIFVWKTITLQTFTFNLLLLPCVIGGGFLGMWLVKLFPEKWFRMFIITTTIISALFLLK